MNGGSQNRAVRSYRQRLSEQGLRRYEVLGLAQDQQLIRALARRLAQNDAEALRLRSELSAGALGSTPSKGGILAALRRSPLVGAELDLTREFVAGRDLEL